MIHRASRQSLDQLHASGSPFAAALIAGGRSHRMGGRDKALLELGGEPMWQRQLRVLRALSPSRLLVSARADQAWTREVANDVSLVPDPPRADQGPLGGIVRCLEVARAPLVVLGIDLPRVTSQWIRENLLSRLAADRGVIFKSAVGYEPLAALYHPSMLDPMRDALDAGRLSLQTVIAECVGLGLSLEIPVTPEIAAALENANTPEEWEDVSS